MIVVLNLTPKFNLSLTSSLLVELENRHVPLAEKISKPSKRILPKASKYINLEVEWITRFKKLIHFIFKRIQKQPKCKPSFPVIEYGNHIPDPTKKCKGRPVHQCTNTLHNGNSKSGRQYIPVTCLPNDGSKGRRTIESNQEE